MQSKAMFFGMRWRIALLGIAMPKINLENLGQSDLRHALPRRIRHIVLSDTPYDLAKSVCLPVAQRMASTWACVSFDAADFSPYATLSRSTASRTLSCADPSSKCCGLTHFLLSQVCRTTPTGFRPWCIMNEMRCAYTSPHGSENLYTRPYPFFRHPCHSRQPDGTVFVLLQNHISELLGVLSARFKLFAHALPQYVFGREFWGWRNLA